MMKLKRFIKWLAEPFTTQEYSFMHPKSKEEYYLLRIFESYNPLPAHQLEGLHDLKGSKLRRYIKTLHGKDLDALAMKIRNDKTFRKEISPVLEDFVQEHLSIPPWNPDEWMEE